MGHEDYRLARAIAVKPARQEARPFGLRGLTAQRGPSKRAVMPSTARSAPSLEPDRRSSLRPALEARGRHPPPQLSSKTL